MFLPIIKIKGRSRSALWELHEDDAVDPVGLVVIKTPFQARVAKQVLVEEGIQIFDLVYFTRNSSPQDLAAYNTLAEAARASTIVQASNHARYYRRAAADARLARRAVHGKKYETAFLASIDALEATSLAIRSSSRLVTFDDGFANFDRTGPFHQTSGSSRAWLYRALLRAPTQDALKKKITHHYTLHPALRNIVDPQRLKKVVVWSGSHKATQTENPAIFFIGHRFSDYLGPTEVAEVRSIAEKFSPERYLLHPREAVPLLPGVPLWDTNGQIAEDALLAESLVNPIHLIGGLSTVMLNLAHRGFTLTVIAPKRFDQDGSVTHMAHLLGIQIIWLGSPEGPTPSGLGRHPTG